MAQCRTLSYQINHGNIIAAQRRETNYLCVRVSKYMRGRRSAVLIAGACRTARSLILQRRRFFALGAPKLPFAPCAPTLFVTKLLPRVQSRLKRREIVLYTCKKQGLGNQSSQQNCDKVHTLKLSCVQLLGTASSMSRLKVGAKWFFKKFNFL